MEYTQFGQTALHVSKMCYGTWQFGGDWGSVERAQWDAGKATIQKALELGINFFDTTPAYGFGLAERMLGEACGPTSERACEKTWCWRQREDCIWKEIGSYMTPVHVGCARE